MQKEGSQVPSTTARWTKRVGIAAFLFFLIKGVILWVIVPAIVAYFALK